MNNKLFLNSASGTMLYFVNIIIVFIMSPIIVKVLGNRDYGIWEMIMSVVGYMGLLDLGVGPALLRYVAVTHSREDKPELQRVISSALIFFITIGAFAVAGLVTLSFYPNLLAWKEQVNTEYLATVILLFAINAALVFPLNVFTAILMGVQSHYLINATRGVFGIARAFLAYYFLVRFPGKGLIVLALLEPIFNLLQLFIYSYGLHRDHTIPNFKLSSCSLSSMKNLFVYGSKSATLMIASRVQNASLPFVISTVLGVGSIVYFTIPSRLIDHAKGFALAMGFPLTPYFASQMTGDDKTNVKFSWLQTSLVLQIITTAMSLIIFFCGERFISIWIGNEYSIAGRGVLYCLVTALFVEAIAPNSSRILMASGHHGRAALMWLILAVVSIPLAVFGGIQWGITGIALGSSSAIIVGNLIMLRMACHDVGVSITEYFQQTLMRLTVPLLLLTFSLWLAGVALPSESYLNLVLQVSLSGLIYLIAIWFLTLTCKNRSHISGKIQLLFKRPDASLT